MNTLRNSIEDIKKRPEILVFMAISTLVLCIIERYSPIATQYGTFSAIFGMDYLEVLGNLSSNINDAFKTPLFLILFILFAILILYAICLVVAACYSGFFHKLFKATNVQERMGSEFVTGIGRYTLKLSAYFFVAVILTVFVFLAVLYSAVPSILMVKLFLQGNSGLLVPMVALVLFSLIADIIVVLFYAMYISYIIPSIICFKKGGVGVSLKISSDYCWYLILRTLLFLIVCLAIRIVLIALGYGVGSTAKTILSVGFAWITRTATYFYYIYYVFSTFNAMKSDMVEVQK